MLAVMRPSLAMQRCKQITEAEVPSCGPDFCRNELHDCCDLHNLAVGKDIGFYYVCEVACHPRDEYESERNVATQGCGLALPCVRH